jgi:signal transduction histidine kinase/ActR/RegA family two-component response regulator
MHRQSQKSSAAIRAGLCILAAATLAGVAVVASDLHGTRAPQRDGLFDWRIIDEGAAALLASAALLALALGFSRRHHSERVVRARLDAVMDNAAGGMALFDHTLRCLRMNVAFADMLAPGAGGSLPRGPGARLWDMLSDASEELAPGVNAALQRGTRTEGLALCRRQADGSRRDWLVSLYPLPDQPGEEPGLGIMAVEVTAQRAAEMRLEFLLELEAHLRDIADPVAMKHALCGLIARQLGAAQASYAELSPPFTHVVVEGGWTDGRVEERPGRRAIGELGTALVNALKQEKSLAVSDARLDPRTAGSLYEHCYAPRGIASLAMVMVMQRGRPSGLVFVSDARPRHWSDADMALLRDAADRSWSAIARGRAAQALRDSEQRFQRAVSGAGIGIWDWDLDANEVTISRGFLPQVHDRLQGGSCAAGDFIAAIHPDDRERMEGVLRRVIEQARGGENFFYEAEYRTVSRRGRVMWLRSQGRVTQHGVDGRATRLSGVTVEVTARRRAEDALTAAQERLRTLNQTLEAQVAREVAAREQAQERLAQGQRLEALAQLSGGIAHDFNNVLQAITGSLALMHRRAGDAEVVRQLAGMAGDAAARGGVITARLLSFARQGELQPAPVVPAALLHSLVDMLEHMMGASIRVRLEAEETLPPLLADKGQLEAALVNLALNAREAMPAGGTLTLNARLDSIGPSDINACGLPLGKYIRIAVTDTGIGMKPAVLARASEPFFTTKPLGQGTGLGLGLAMARGFAEQSGGGFLLTSAAGEGTTVCLWLPLADASPLAAETAEEAPALHDPTAGGLARLLLVDDDTLVREVLAGQLEELGYRVTRAHSGPGALARLDAGETPDIMITDYAMPGMNGAVLLAEARRRRPRLPVLLLTGFADNSLRLNMEEWDAGITRLLRKPVSSDVLAKAASAVLQGAALSMTHTP